jgi:hypothetical protein
MTEDTAETRLAKTLFVMEATSFERYALWCRHAYNSHERPPKAECVQWEERLGEGYMPHGWLVQVGRVGKRPCYIDIQWARIDGQMICFYHDCSQLTDTVQTEKWFTRHFKGTWDKGSRRATGDAQNFHHCLHAIEEANAQKRQELPDTKL